MNGLRVDISFPLGDFEVAAKFQVSPGERVALLGPSGCGKTSLLRGISGLLAEEIQEQVQGKIFLGENDLLRLTPEKKGIGFVFQDQALFSSMSVLDNISFALRMQGVGAEERRKQVLPWVERVGLQERLHSRVDSLSGGERQRVAFLRAIVWKPQLIFLDEPFSALDSSLRSSLRNLLVELHKKWPAPLLFVTHDEQDVEAIATRKLRFQVIPSKEGREKRLFSDESNS